MKIKITKANANGNSFIIINQIDLKANNSLSKIQILKLCNAYNTDGLIIIIKKSSNIKIDYFNNDGSWETLCVNGVICAALKLQNQHLPYKIECGDGLHTVNSEKDKFIVSMHEPVYKSKKIIIDNIFGYYIDSGAKHFVIEHNGHWPSNNKLIDLAKTIRYNKNLFPDGINVNFFKKINNNTIEVKTYEKGIENLMDSCASGSFACAYHFHKNHSIKLKINIINPGGKYYCRFNDNYKYNSIISSGKLEFEDDYTLI